MPDEMEDDESSEMLAVLERWQAGSKHVVPSVDAKALDEGKDYANLRTLRRLGNTVLGEGIVTADEHGFKLLPDGRCSVRAQSESEPATVFRSVLDFLRWLEPRVKAMCADVGETPEAGGAKPKVKTESAKGPKQLTWSQSSWDRTITEVLQSVRNETLVQT